MGLFDGLFGGGGDVDVDFESLLTPEQNAALRQLLAEGPRVEEGTAGVPGVTPTQQISLAGLEQLALQLGQQQEGNVPFQTTETAQGFTQDVLTQDPTDFEEFFQRGIADPMRQELGRTVEDIETRFAPQFFGGERQEAVARTREDFMDALLRERSRTALGFREQDIRQGLGAASLAPGLETEGVTGDILSQILGVGEVERGPASQSLDEEFRRRELFQRLLNVGAGENIVEVDEGGGFLSEFLAGAAGPFGKAAGGAIF